ncbi:glycoside hydrolase family 32 protein [Bacillus sp. HMF5848]|uniref:glycoside hydrolase family 32 protein n=1 Tax=Bacillus sp. HMF5848 TaxID=2495421 RepID=UPI000F78BD06|nr:glycoside hydrolase family 32 protein [Bacillus sp. HMF5848]RSK28737.1 glycoside hydrolase family 32 protein [Bacillus sp. HMF5848]
MAKKIRNKTYRHTYHLMPECGWMNDPNGFSLFNGEYHLFYQHYPYDSIWGPMHWGHAVSTDLIKWTHKPIALKPDEDYDRNGVFSGSGLQVENEHWLYYTGHIDSYLDTVYDENFKKKSQADSQGDTSPYIRQVQCLAKSKDGTTYHKYEHNPIIGSEQIPPGIRIEDFRDPKVWQNNGTYYMVVGAKSIDHIGHVLFYTSQDGIAWEYLNDLTLGKEYGTVWECPDIFELDGKHVLLFSPQEKPRVGHNFENIHSTMALVGQFEYETGTFAVEFEQELDQGFDFYAPQSLLTAEGKRVMIGWMNMWDMKYPLHELRHDWNGSMSLPRELSLKNGKLIQKPYHTIESYQKNEVQLRDLRIDGEYNNSSLSGKSQHLNIAFDMTESNIFKIECLKGDCESISMTFYKNRNEMVLDRRASNYPIENLRICNDYNRSQHINLTNKVKLDIFLDVSSIEIFVNDGEYVFTSLFFSKELGDNVALTSDGVTYIEKLVKSEIC